MEFKQLKLIILLVAIVVMATAPCHGADTKGRFFLTVTDANGDPVADAKVTLVSTESAEKTYSLETNKKGKVIKIGLDPDYYKLKIEKEGYQFLEGKVKLRAGVNVKLEETLLTEVQAKATATQEVLDGMTEEEKNRMNAEEAHNRGFAAYQEGNLEDAEKEFLEAIKLDPEIHHMDYLLLGQFAFNRHDAAGAQKYLEKALELDVNQEAMGDICTLLGASYMVQQDLENARKIWTQQVEFSPNPTVLHNLASIEVQNGDMDAAVKWLKMCAETFPDYKEAIQLLGDIYIQQNNYPDALKAYKQLQSVMEKDENVNPDTLKEIKDTVKVLEEQVK